MLPILLLSLALSKECLVIAVDKDNGKLLKRIDSMRFKI